MKLIKAILLTAALAALALTAAPAAADVDWLPYAKGMEKGEGGQKKIMVNFWADWCKYCSKMDQETFGDPEIAKYLNQNFVTIRVDADKAKELSSSYNVRGLPTTVFLEPDGEYIAPVSGFAPPEKFLPILKYLKTNSYQDMTFPEFMEKQ